MRKPKLYKDVNLSNDVGLSSYLAGITEYKHIVHKTKFQNFDLISGGLVPLTHPNYFCKGEWMNSCSRQKGV